ncbi:MAG: isopentenyl-diphosphate Delta-isomerase [Cyclobacteriaceae bacterium]|nr:isopentenyl-diphosphate Delta-isomerase [Cyclobacteriaceae bacterium]MDW8332235.1 isopentenyl-diphosphate Delta-isomerase [Cyclobacteriaceae bacterium]
MEQVILVDEHDRQTGVMEKMEAHRKGVLHRAISVVIFNSKGELLLQQRALSKYHSGGLWTNTCCSHPRPGESTEEAAQRRLQEEMGIQVRPDFAYSFRYKAALENDLTEHEFDHVFTALFDGKPAINTNEVSDWKFISLPDLHMDVLQNPHAYTAWFRLMLTHPEFKNMFRKNNR